MKKISIILFAATLFCITNGVSAQSIFDSPPRDGTYDKIHVKNRKPVPYTNLREADVFWNKRIWRIIDMREKINHPLYYPIARIDNRRSIMQVMLDGIEEESLTAYDATSDEFLIPMTKDQALKILYDTITKSQQRLDPPFDWYDTTYVEKFNTADVKQLRIKEDWFFDKQRSVMDVRILGICPIIDDIDDNGNVRGKKALFWIYFPEARPLFAQVEVFNRFNNAERRTLDDIFFKRLFNSYIYKEENVYDRFINEYARGLDGLLEAERIKNEIFLLEHDLWEY